MRLSRRLLWAAACLGVLLAAQLALQLHLAAAGEHTYPELKQPLEVLPLTLSAPSGAGSSDGRVSTPVAWHGIADPGQKLLRDRLPFAADDLLLRAYHTPGLAQPLELYMVHSRAGEDRKHHPEVCIRDVAGAPEDTSARRVLYLDAAQKRPAQRFRFRTGNAEYTTVYYWHYTFAPLPREGLTMLQSLHQRLSRAAPSVTVQVATTAPPEQLALVETTFLPALDSALRAGPLPEQTTVDCQRLPILVLRH